MPQTSATARTAEPRHSTPRSHWRLKITLGLDATLAAAICALEEVRFTGLVMHEWLGIAFAGMAMAHLLLSWPWIASQSRRIFTGRRARARVNYLMNLTLFAGAAAVIWSGIRISQKAVPALRGTNAAAQIDWRWDRVHNQFSTWMLIFAGLHLAMNWDWALAAIGKLFGGGREGGL